MMPRGTPRIQINLRVSAELLATLNAFADYNCQGVNAEIISRLRRSFRDDPNAEAALKEAAKHIEDRENS